MYPAAVVFPAGTFGDRDSQLQARQQDVDAMLDRLQESRVFLTSYGNVAGRDSLVSVAEFERLRATNDCLCLVGIRRIMNNCSFLQRSRRWNQLEDSRALRVLYLETERWLLPVRSPELLGRDPPDASELGHGEFIAAMLFLGYAAKFDAITGTGCLFQCRITAGTEAAILRSREVAAEAIKIGHRILGNETDSSSEEDDSCEAPDDDDDESL